MIEPLRPTISLKPNKKYKVRSIPPIKQKLVQPIQKNRNGPNLSHHIPQPKTCLRHLPLNLCHFIFFMNLCRFAVVFLIVILPWFSFSENVHWGYHGRVNLASWLYWQRKRRSCIRFLRSYLFNKKEGFLWRSIPAVLVTWKGKSKVELVGIIPFE